MSRVELASRWIYRGVWSVLVRWFHVPQEPPVLPVRPGRQLTSFRPAEGFLRYLKFHFWVILVIVDLALAIGWVALLIAFPLAGVLTAPLALALIVVPDIVAYIAIHLRYDTTWYVMTERSMRIRRGIWIIHETTITFENIQNVTVNQGPLQRFFGIADVRVETAGGGGQVGGKGEHGSALGAHQGLLEGVSNAAEIRDLIQSRVKRSQTSGLGDERLPTPAARGTWTPQHLVELRAIRDLVVRSAPASAGGS